MYRFIFNINDVSITHVKQPVDSISFSQNLKLYHLQLKLCRLKKIYLITL